MSSGIAPSPFPADTAAQIVRRYAAGETSSALATEFNINRKHVFEVATGKWWRDVYATVNGEAAP